MKLQLSPATVSFLKSQDIKARATFIVAMEQMQEENIGTPYCKVEIMPTVIKAETETAGYIDYEAFKKDVDGGLTVERVEN